MLNEDFQLKTMANKIAKAKWGVEFNGNIKLSEKLLPLRQYGRFVPESNTIYIASQLYLNEQRTEFANKVILHELCHWYSFQNGLEYHDGVTPFESFLQEYGAITNGNYAYTDEKVAFHDKIEVMECEKCKQAQFDKVPNTRNILIKSHCCDAKLVGRGREVHTYNYYEYK